MAPHETEPKFPHIFHGEEYPLNFLFFLQFLNTKPKEGDWIGIHKDVVGKCDDADLFWELDTHGKGMVVSRGRRQ